MDSDLSGGKRLPTFEQLGQAVRGNSTFLKDCDLGREMCTQKADEFTNN